MSRSYDPNVAGGANPENMMMTATVRPADRVRWSAIIAGLVTAIATMVLLGVLGAAIGLTAYDQGESGRAYGVAAGLWGIITAILAFFVGGYIAARTAGIFGRDNAILNGTMVWATTIPLSLWVLTGGATRLLGAAASNPDFSQPVMASSMPGRDQTQQQNAGATNAMNNIANNVQNDADRTADRAARTAWFTLVSLLLGLGAAALGGHVGARGVRDRDDDDDDRKRGGMFRDRDREWRPATTTGTTYGTTTGGGTTSGTHPYGGPVGP
jgi:hypothetical protein